MHLPEKVLHSISRLYSLVGLVCLIVMFLTTVVDVLLRVTIGRPILGAYEITQLGLSILVFTGLAYAEALRGHVIVDLVFDKLQGKLRLFTIITINLLTLGTVSILAWRAWLFAGTEWQHATTSAALRIPVFPFVYIAAIGLALYGLELLLTLIKSITEAVRE